MAERIRELLRRVAAAEGSSEPRDRELRERLPAVGRAGLPAIEREIASEIAHSLGKAGRLLEAAITQARGTLAALESEALGAAERRALLERFSEQRAAAERRLRDLLIQREALGLRRHADVHRVYVIPSLPPER